MHPYNREQIAQSRLRITLMRALRKTMTVRQLARRYNVSTQRIYALLGRK